QNEVRAELRPIPIAMLESDTPDVSKPEVEEALEPEAEEQKPEEKEKKKLKKPEIAPETKPKPPEAKPEQKTEAPPEKKPEEKKDLNLLAKPAETKPAETKPPQELDLERQKRIAVRQHVQDKNQKDNPDAKHLGEHANRVEEESQARITSTDQDHPQPTPGSSPQNESTKEPGNSEESRVASAFGDSDEGSALSPPPPEDHAPPSKASPQPKEEHATKSEPKRAEQRRPAERGQQQQAEDPGARQSPNLIAGETGEHAMGGPAQPRPKRKRLPPVKATNPSDLFGLGRGARTASGINLNLSHSDAVAVVGQEQLQADRRMDQLRRRSKRAGSWKLAGIERYRSAIENYVPSVNPGNTTALNTAASPFATYLNDIHNRIHPIFADDFLGSLNRLPASDPMNRPDLRTEVEIVVSKTDGSLVRRGLTKSSGILQFDVSALASVDRAAPFGPPPAAIVSPDGNVYLHWEFYRNPDFACSTYFAHPFILKAAPTPSAPKQAPEEPGPRELPGPRIMPTFAPTTEQQGSKAARI
ncbi:MAG TPA: TonB C-terminal domain-containing protein, partial [Polyangiaceae bacterium]|nr:TonB C-terminal domain-containing protein [Polyangiaceae bacterium]